MGTARKDGKIKIAFVIDSLNSVAGTEKQLVETMNRLRREVFDIHLICLRAPSALLNFSYDAVEYVQLNINKLISFQCLVRSFRLFRHLRKAQIDIIQCYFFDSILVGTVVGKLAGVRKVISCRRDLGYWYTKQFTRVLKLINPFADRFLINSKSVMSGLIANEKPPTDKIDLIYNGIDTGYYQPIQNKLALKQEFAIDAGKHVVGIVANLNRPVKRVDVFLKAASVVLKARDDVHFVIVGDGYLSDGCKRMCESLGIRDAVFFAGRQDDVRPFITMFDIGVLCSDSEGFSNSILEYMSCGVPVIATRVGGNQEVVRHGETGMLVDPGSYQQIGEDILALLDNPEKSRFIRDNAYERVRRFYDWKVKIAEIEAYYKRLTEF